MSSATRLNFSRRVTASAQDAYRIVVEVERFPEFMDNVTSVEILSGDAARKIVAWQLMIDDAPLDWVEEVDYDATRLRADFRALEGVFERFDGHWQVFPDQNGARVELELVYEIGLPEIEDVINPILRTRLSANLDAMMACLDTRAASI